LKDDGLPLPGITPSQNYSTFTIETTNTTDKQEDNDVAFNNKLLNNRHKNARRSRYLRTTLETSVLLGAVSLYYWGTKSFAADFDYDVSLETLQKKLSGQAILFDDNSLEANSFPGHPLAGAYYYLIARNNHLSRTESSHSPYKKPKS
jgi:hypothetical protein